jgi:hypothetical protein
MDRLGLMALIHDMYEIDGLTRRVLHERFAPNTATFQRYRNLVRAAVFPDPLSYRSIRLREAAATIREYQRATGNLTGTVDLMLDFVEAGTAQAADLGYGEATYFTALERKVNEIVGLLHTLPSAERRLRTERLIRLGEYQASRRLLICAPVDLRPQTRRCTNQKNPPLRTHRPTYATIAGWSVRWMACGLA